MGVAKRCITIGGEAGQGLVTIGDLLVKVLVRAGYFVLVTQDYMSRVRGGHNTYTIRVSTEPLVAATEEIDLLLALDEETVEAHATQVAEGGVIVGDASFKTDAADYLRPPYKDLAEGRYANVAALGVAGALLGLEREKVLAALERAFGKKHPEAVEKNAAALQNAYDWCLQNARRFLKLDPPGDRPGRLTMNGNDAIALGAMAAGVRFCAFYPMTPATTVALNLAARAEKLGLVVEQAEDEIAAVNMCIGASYAGAPALTTTSGGGFALMVEGVSLAAITETPLTVVVVQRPGPATGLPTRTEQADLEFVLHAGHGEFPRAVFAPGDIEECFHLTRRAVDLAERYQTPVFVLSDQYLADSFRAVEPFDLDAGPEAAPYAAHDQAVQTPYRRYRVTETGVSPRLLPGRSEHLVGADSDEHSEDGRIIEDAETRIAQNEKRLRKTEGLRSEALAPEYTGDENPDTLLVCWGSTKGPALEAAETLRDAGTSAAILYFSQLWPLNPESFLGKLESAGRVVAVEGNAFGQLARLIRRETGFDIKDRVLRHDGRPLYPAYILDRLDGPQGA